MMTLYRYGDHGHAIVRIQRKLLDLGYFEESVTGNFDDATEEAVRAFQVGADLDVDGVVGPATWFALFGTGIDEEVPDEEPDTSSSGLAYKCLSLTGSFETSRLPPACFAGLAGNFDGQGLSFGALQWNLGQGTLQPMLKEMNAAYAIKFREAFGANADVLLNVVTRTIPEQIAWAKTIQDSKFHVQSPWKDQFEYLGLSEEYQGIETAHASKLFAAGLLLCDEYGLDSERGAALMFDIKVQNGSIKPETKALILQDFRHLTPSGDPATDEIAKMVIIANRRAEASHAVEDVRARKLTIANGKGTVHGASYNLESQFGITMAARP